MLCTFLYERTVGGQPHAARCTTEVEEADAESLPRTAVEALLSAVTQESDTRRTDWKERDLAVILTAPRRTAGEELRLVDVGDIRTLDDGSAVINVKGKGGKERNVPIESAPAGGDRYVYG